MQVTDPTKPVFVRYFNNRNYDAQYTGVTVDNAAKMGFLAPEMVKYIPASKSPVDHALLLTAYEVSGDMAIFEVEAMPNGMGASSCKCFICLCAVDVFLTAPVWHK